MHLDLHSRFILLWWDVFVCTFLIQRDCWSRAELCLRTNGWQKDCQWGTKFYWNFVLMSTVYSHPTLTSLTIWFPSLADFLFKTLFLLSFSFASFVSRDRLHCAWVTKISVSPQCKHLPLALATWSPLATRRFYARGPWAKQSLLTEWGNALEHMTLKLSQ